MLRCASRNSTKGEFCNLANQKTSLGISLQWHFFVVLLCMVYPSKAWIIFELLGLYASIEMKETIPK